ncbi:uncharacterized protein TNIN_482001 [Trichonephila inaurata madagascariensis]|uniref:Uncharacterized protein n=1 Tax=Trichonephila inaurata madagascariensis TaxID=2747483 RepID=A0A8X6ML22_9ARAC|nr:uncharacterized protein TNIN_482001 [Trichonephila inaurata madagascariensis]
MKFLMLALVILGVVVQLNHAKHVANSAQCPPIQCRAPCQLVPDDPNCPYCQCDDTCGFVCPASCSLISSNCPDCCPYACVC